MQEKAKIVAINGSIVTLIPQDIGVCINCTNSACKRNGHVFTARNSHGFHVEPGMLVTVKADAMSTVFQTVTGIVIPFLMAVAAYFIAKYLFPSFSSTVCGAIAVGTFFVSCGVFAAVHQSLDPSRLAEITAVL